MKKTKCSICGFEISNNNLKKHQSSCVRGPRRILRLENSIKGSIECRKKISRGVKKSLENHPEIKIKISEKVKLAYKEKRISGKGRNKEVEEKRKEKIREKINKRYLEGWESKPGKCKKIDYESPIAGKIKVDGTWELKVAQYLDSIGVNWSRNKKRFDYIRSNGKCSTYCPDFYIKEWESYLEVKGYETDLDRCKWSQFKEPLMIWKKRELKELNIL